MLSVHEIVAQLSDEERERFKDLIEEVCQTEIELRGIQARSLEAAAELSKRFTKIMESLQRMAKTTAQLKEDIDRSQHVAQKALSEVSSRRDRDLQACIERIPAKMFARA